MRYPLRKYWKGEVPLQRVFWFDLLLVGSVVNAVTAAGALAALALHAPVWLAAGIFAAPLPYNLLLCFFVWRAAAHHPSGWAGFAKLAAALWFVAALVI